MENFNQDEFYSEGLTIEQLEERIEFTAAVDSSGCTHIIKCGVVFD